MGAIQENAKIEGVHSDLALSPQKEDKLKNKFITSAFILFILCLIDAVTTDFGLRNDLVTEANPLMDWMYGENVFLFYAVKLAMPSFLICLIYKYFDSLGKSKLIKWSYAFCFLSYVLVCIWHLIWIALAFSL